MHYIDKELNRDREFFVPRIINPVNLGVRGLEKKERIFPDKTDPKSISAYLGIILSQQSPTAIFCGSKKTISSISKLLVDYYSRGLDIGKPLDKSDQSEIEKIAKLAYLHFEQNSIFPEAIGLGILPHSANIPNGLRVSSEWAMEHNKAALVVCTSTLAQGVNLPIKYLVISSTFQASEEISTRDFHNLMGRAGRSGYHTEGSIIFANPNIYDKKREYRDKWRWERAIHLLDPTNSEACTSSLKQLIEPFDFHLFIVDEMKFIKNPEKYKSLCKKAAEKQQLDISGLLAQMNHRKNTIHAIESYLLSYMKDNENIDDDFIVALSNETLAHHLSSDVEKSKLITAFQTIFQTVKTIEPEKLPYYGKALLGVEALENIEGWLDENLEALKENNNIAERFTTIWPLLLSSLSDNKYFKKFTDLDAVLEASIFWLSGQSYSEIFTFMKKKKIKLQAATRRMNLNMDHIVDFTGGTLSYDSVLIVGALADISEGKYSDDELTESLHNLQSALKVGLSRKLDLWFHSKGFVDREICKLLTDHLVKSGVDCENFNNNILKKHNDLISEVTSTMPSYFSNILVK